MELFRRFVSDPVEFCIALRRNAPHKFEVRAVLRKAHDAARRGCDQIRGDGPREMPALASIIRARARRIAHHSKQQKQQISRAPPFFGRVQTFR